MSVLDDYIQSEYVTKEIEKSGDTGFACVNAEESIIRLMLRSDDVAEEAALSLTGKDFYNVDYGRLFNAIQAVLRDGQHVDTVTVEAAAVKLFPKRAAKLRELLVVLSKYVAPTVDGSHGIADYVSIVTQLARRRQSAKKMDELVRLIHDPSKDINETLLSIREAVDNTGIDNGGSVSLQDVLARTFESIERRQKGEEKIITSGLSCLDKLICGFYGGEMTVIAARPSVGKSAFAQFIAIHAAGQGHKVGFVSCEMVDVAFGQRILSNRAMVDGMNLRRGEVSDEEWGRIAAAMSEMGSLTIDFKFDSNYIEDIEQWARKKARRGELDLLIVDYLQIVEVRKRFDAEHLRVGYISKTLKKIAKELNIPVIALAQVNRETEGSMPTLKNLKDSGSIEQDCDGVLFLHRPKNADDPCVDARDKPMLDTLAENGCQYLVIGVAKQRMGNVGMVDAIYRPKYIDFSALSRN